ncbi:uncharacterized protein LOC143509912 [Brachyhypopomus gauderio]|uniref:uncharacterized protein LOC143509912 n=1 Tax=Brachyhypopomus gauderio TaxID=698409 RepID=UPI00404383DA
MNRYSILTSVLVGLLTLADLLSTSALGPVKVELHSSATLPCNHMCSGLATWTVIHKQLDILAQCDQSSCQSKEGFHMSHDQYLKGDLSLTITDVDYTKRTLYTCECDSVDLCDVSLQIEAPEFSRLITPGESLILDVPVSEPVELFVNRTGDASLHTVKLCEVRDRIVQCISEYEKRVSLSSSLQLKELTESDSGVYTIRDIRNDEIVSTFRVTVEGKNKDITLAPKKDVKESWLKRNYQGLLTGLASVLVLWGLWCYYPLLIPTCCKRKAQRFSRGHCAVGQTCGPPALEDTPLKTVCEDAGPEG